MSMIKYRVHEVAKDFNVTSKVISQILTDYIAPPKNHMQVLENHELDVIFEYMTQHNQAASLEDIFKVPEKPAAAAKKDAAPEKTAAAPEKKPAQQSTAPAQPQQPAYGQPQLFGNQPQQLDYAQQGYTGNMQPVQQQYAGGATGPMPSVQPQQPKRPTTDANGVPSFMKRRGN